MHENKADSVYAYRREHNFEQKERRGKKGRRKRPVNNFFLFLIEHVKLESLALAVMGFFLGRTVLLGELHPCGVAFVAGIFWSLRPQGIFACVGVLTGLLTVMHGNALPAQIISIFLTGVGAYLIPVNSKRPWLVVPGLVFAIVMVVRGSFLALSGAIAYDYISVSFEAVFAVLFTLLIIKAIPALFLVYSPGALKGEELFCIMALAGGVVAGTGEISWGVFALKSVLSYFFILIAALAGGTGLGAATGAVVGVIPGLAFTEFPAVVGTYSFSGLLAGLFRSFGKPGVVVGFLLGNIILSMYMSSYNQLASVVSQTVLVALILCFIPGKWITELKISLVPMMNDIVDKNGPQQRVKQLVAERMDRWSGVFKEIARSFEQTAATGFPTGEEQNLQALFNEVGEKVCKGCSHYSTCWEREFYKTYQNLLALFAVAENYGRVTVDDLDDETVSRCNRVKELAITITCLHEMFNLNRFWSRRLNESNGLVSEQLRGIGEVIENLSAELESGGEFYRQEAQAIKQKLKKMGLSVFSLEIYDAGGDFPEVNITMPSCGGRMICRYEIGPFLSREMGCRMSVATVSCSETAGKEFCSFRVYPNPRYQFSLGVAAIGKDGSVISGDSYLFLPLPGGKFAVLLSDGMGSGQRAAMESSATLGLIARLLDSGFSRDLAIKTVNSILLLRSPEESFATVDMTVLDLYTAEAEFVKIGASPGFVVRGQQVGTVRANSLPVGIVNEVEVFTMSRHLNHGDMVIMVTDGVLDACNGGEEKEDWLVEVLQEISGLKPQEVAELIVSLAQTGSNRDDMTVVAVKVGTVKND